MKQFVILLISCWSWVSLAQTSYPSNTWIMVREKGKIGYIDPKGKVCIAPTFDHATPFKEGLAFVWSFPDEEQDKRDVPLGEEYVNYETLGLNANRRTGIIDTTGKYVVEPRINFEYYSHFTNGAALVEISNEILFIDRTGKEIDYFEHYPSEQQLKAIRRVARIEGSIPYKYGYVDAFRTAKIQAFDEALPFFENRAAVRLGERFGYISTSGDMVIVPQFKRAGHFQNGLASVAVLIDAADQRTLRYGLMDSLGKYVIPPVYDFLGEPSEGTVVFGIGDGDGNVTKYGLLSVSGDTLIAPTLEDARMMSEGLIAVQTKKNYGYMNAKGELVIPSNYYSAGPFKNGAATVRLAEEKYAVINTSGKIIFGPYTQKLFD